MHPSTRPVASALRRGLLLLCAGIALSPPAFADPVQHTFTGVVGSVSDGTSGTADLTGTFSPGQAVTIVTVIDRTTPGYDWENGGRYYLGALTGWGVTLGTYVRPLAAPVSPVGIFVGNDLASGPGAASAQGSVDDVYDVTISTPGLPDAGNAVATYVIVHLIDRDATVLADNQLPGTLPDLAEFESATWTIQFVADGTTFGSIRGPLDAAATPAAPATWGRVKADYRR